MTGPCGPWKTQSLSAVAMGSRRRSVLGVSRCSPVQRQPRRGPLGDFGKPARYVVWRCKLKEGRGRAVGDRPGPCSEGMIRRYSRLLWCRRP